MARTNKGFLPFIQDKIVEAKRKASVSNPEHAGKAAAKVAQANFNYATRDTYADDIAKLTEALGPAPQISYTPIAKDFASNYAPIAATGVSPEYFSAQKESLKEQLRQEFFGQTGVAQQTASSESAAGRLGSGVGKRILEETVTRPFISGAGQIDRDILSAELQERARVEQFNAEQFNQFSNIVATLESADSANALSASTANAQLSAQYSELAARLADAKAGRSSAEAIAKLDADTRIYVSGLDSYYKAAALQEEQRANKAAEAENIRRGQTNYLATIGQFRPQTPESASLASRIAESYGVPKPSPDARALGSTVGLTTDRLGFGQYVGQVKNLPEGGRAVWNGSTWTLAA